MQIDLDGGTFDAGDDNFLRAALSVIENDGIGERPILAFRRD
jgi:hypothetical protein